MKSFRRIFALFLALALVVPLLPDRIPAPLEMKVSAAENISNAAQLLALINGGVKAGDYIQTADITISTVEQKRALPGQASVFKGTYDGNGYTITFTNFSYTMLPTGYANANPLISPSSHYHNGSSNWYYGYLFDEIEGATIKNVNVHLASPVVRGRALKYNDWIGGIVGRAFNSTIQNCSIGGSLFVHETPYPKGGDGGSGTVDDYRIHQKDIYESYRDNYWIQCAVGGIVGKLDASRIERCFSNLAITAGSQTSANQILVEYEQTGGNPTANANVKYAYFVGGLAGEMHGYNGSSYVENNLIQDAKISAGLGSGYGHNAYSNIYTGAIAGIDWSSNTPVYIRNNVVRGTTVNSQSAGFTDGYGSTAMLLIGTSRPESNRNYLTNNYSLNNTFAANQGMNGWSVVCCQTPLDLYHSAVSHNPGNSSSTPNAGNLSSAWVDDIYQTTNVDLAWRTLMHPGITGYDIKGPNDPPPSTITIEPPMLPMPNQSTRGDAKNLRYELRYTTRGKLATPGAVASSSNNAHIITLTHQLGTVTNAAFRIKESDSPTADFTGVSPTTDRVIQLGNTATGDIQSGTKYYHIMATDTTATWADSDPITFTVVRTAKGNDEYEYKLSHSGDDTGKLAIPLATYEHKNSNFFDINLAAPSGSGASVSWGSNEGVLNQTTTSAQFRYDGLINPGDPGTIETPTKKTTSLLFAAAVKSGLEDSVPIEVALEWTRTMTKAAAGADPAEFKDEYALITKVKDSDQAQIKGRPATPTVGTFDTSSASEYTIQITAPFGCTFKWGDTDSALGNTTSPIKFAPTSIATGAVRHWYARAYNAQTAESSLLTITVAKNLKTAGTPPSIVVTPPSSTSGGGTAETTKTVSFTADTPDPTATDSTPVNGVSHKLVDSKLQINIADIVKPDSQITLTAWMKTHTQGGYTYNRNRKMQTVITTGKATPAPLILPGISDSLAGGVTIQDLGTGNTLYYSIGGANPVVNADGTAGTGTVAGAFISWDTLEKAFGNAETLIIKAVAKGDGKNVSSVTTATYGINNKPPCAAPVLMLDGISHNSNNYYSKTTIVSFDYPSGITEGEIWYTYGDQPPTGTNHYTYKPGDTTVALPDDVSTVQINAVLVRSLYPNSLMSSTTVRIKTKHRVPVYSTNNDARIPIEHNLHFILDPNDLPYEIRPAFYMKEGDDTTYSFQDVVNSPGEYYGVLLVTSSGGAAFDYDSYAKNIPTLYYTVGTQNERTYAFGKPEIRYIDENGNVVSNPPMTANPEYVDAVQTPDIEPYIPGDVDPTKPLSPTPHTNSTNPAKLAGEAGATIEVASRLLAKNLLAYENGESVSQNFIFYTALATPTAVPPPLSGDDLRVVKMGEKISLSCDDSEAKIFYSMTGTPSVTTDKDGNFIPGNSDTKEYIPQDGVKVEKDSNGAVPGTYFVINAIAVKKEMSNSKVAKFTYQVADLEKVVAPTVSPTTKPDAATTLPEGTKISLTTSTVGAEIYWSKDGVLNVAEDNITVTGSGVTKYSSTSGIPVEGNAGDFFAIYAVAVKAGMNPSDAVTFTYQLPAPVQSVLANPLDGEVIKGTEVSLSTTTTGAVIFYEIETGRNSADDPVPLESAVYDPAKPFKIEQETWITAVAYKDKVSSSVTEYHYTVAGQVSEPTPSIPGGSVVAKGTKVTLTSDSGASIVYTKDGSDPSDETNKNRMFGSEIIIDADEGKSVNVTVYATKTGKTPSEVVSLSYTVSKAGEVLWANPAQGTAVSPGDSILLSTSVSGGVIHYTTDGTEPGASSPSGTAVTVSGKYGENFVLRAAVVANGVVTGTQLFNYKIIDQTPAPSANIPGNAVFLEGAEVVLSATEGKIFYTSDGSDPTSSSHMYTAPIPLTGSMVLKAVAIADSKAPSAIVEYVYTRAGQVAAPTASRQSGSIEISSRIELTTATEGASIYYTTNGVEPSQNILKDIFLYDSPIIVSRPVTIKMFAVKKGLLDSVVNTVTYTVAEPPPEDENKDSPVTQKDSDKLFLFDQYVESGTGPQFKDILLQDPQTMAVLSANADALPPDVQLIVERRNSPSAEESDAVRRATELQIAALYDITLMVNGEPVQPLNAEGVEIGIPIPEGFEDGIVLIVRINENGTVTTFPTRRDSNVAYAVVDHFSRYAVVVPQITADGASGRWLHFMSYAAAVVLLAGAVVLIVYMRKKRKKTSKPEQKTV